MIKLYYAVPGAIEKAQNELRALLPQKFHIPSSQLRLLNSIGHGTFILNTIPLIGCGSTVNSVCGHTAKL